MNIFLTLFISLPVLAAFLSLIIIITRYRERKELEIIFKSGKEYDAVILDVFPSTPVLFSGCNVWLRVQITSGNGNPHNIRFEYEATCLEWPDLYQGSIIRIEFNPANPRKVLIHSAARYLPG